MFWRLFWYYVYQNDSVICCASVTTSRFVRSCLSLVLLYFPFLCKIGCQIKMLVPSHLKLINKYLQAPFPSKLSYDKILYRRKMFLSQYINTSYTLCSTVFFLQYFFLQYYTVLYKYTFSWLEQYTQDSVGNRYDF